MTTIDKPQNVTAALDEELAQRPLQITGEIPKWLSGTLVRNGPIVVTVDGRPNEHEFDGLAMLHAFDFHEGRVTYTNKFLRTDAFRKVFEDGSLDYNGFAQDPCRSIFRKFLTWLLPHRPEMQNANINVAKLADQYVALYETPLPVRFDRKTLDTLGVLNYEDELPKERAWESAHPHHDQENKETFNYLINYGRTSYYTLYRMKDGSSKREIIAEIPVEEPAYMHSFAVTKNYIVLAEYPFVVKPLDLIMGSKPFIKNFTWHPERGTQFIVVDKKNGKVARHKAEPFYAFHHANAYEEGGKLHFDIVRYNDAGIISGLKSYFDPNEPTDDKGQNKFPPRLERYTLTLDTGKFESKTLLNNVCEFPRVNEAFDGRPYKFVYLADARDYVADDDVRPLYKVNVSTKEKWQWAENGSYPGEPVFVAAPEAQNEDDGVVLALVLDHKRNSSYLLVLDAKSFKEVGRATVSHAIPPGLHGQYFQ